MTSTCMLGSVVVLLQMTLVLRGIVMSREVRPFVIDHIRSLSRDYLRLTPLWHAVPHGAIVEVDVVHPLRWSTSLSRRAPLSGCSRRCRPPRPTTWRAGWCAASCVRRRPGRGRRKASRCAAACRP
eukprot:7217134-Prymnesium_polylepis.3